MVEAAWLGTALFASTSSMVDAKKARKARTGVSRLSAHVSHNNPKVYPMNRMIRLPQPSSQLTLIAPLAGLILAGCGIQSNPPDMSTDSVSNSLTSAATSATSLVSASPFAVLGASTVTCANLSGVTGELGVSPGTAITGFNPDCTTTGTIHAGDTVAAQAQSGLLTAYDAIAGTGCEHNLTGQDLGSMTLVPGVYCFDSSVGLTGQLMLDAGGNSDAIWVFQIGSTITTASNSSVVMAGGGQPCNVFWQVGSSATLGTGTAFQGNILALASITMTTGANLVGRALALTAAVTLDHNNVSLGICSKPDGAGGSSGNAGSSSGNAGSSSGNAGSSSGNAGGSSGNAGGSSGGSTCPGNDQVNGSGWIKGTSPWALHNFSVAAGIKQGALSGRLTYKDHGCKGPNVTSQSVTSYTVLDATTRRIKGTARVNGRLGFTYQVDVSDQGGPGATDTFALLLSNGYSASGVLRRGDIKLQTSQGHEGACDDSDGLGAAGKGGNSSCGKVHEN